MSKTIDFFFELGQLRKVKHAGMYLAGIKYPDSVAEHVHRAAEIAYILALVEAADPHKTAVMVLFHDNGEARVLDAHRVASRYIDSKKGEKKAMLEQLENLPANTAKNLKNLFEEFEARQSREAQCAKDADYLEQALTAREYITQGYKECQDWINNISKALRTKTARTWLEEINKANPCSWWHGLKALPKKDVK